MISTSSQANPWKRDWIERLNKTRTREKESAIESRKYVNPIHHSTVTYNISIMQTK